MDEDLNIVLELEGLPQEEGHVRLPDLVEELDALLSALNCIDRTVDQSRKPTLDYRVVAATHSSPLRITLEPFPKNKTVKAEGVKLRHDRFFRELKAVSDHGALSEDVDDETLQAFKRLVNNHGKGFSKATIHNHDSKINLDEQFRSNVTLLLAQETYSYGRVSGTLEAINIHGEINTFWLYPQAGPSRIICKFAPGTKEKAKACLGKVVKAYGKKTFRPNAAFPHRIEVSDFEAAEHTGTALLDLRGIAAASIANVETVTSIKALRDEW